MGNYNSCKNITSPMIKTTLATRVILPNGEISRFRGQVKAAELMLETPNYFLVNATSLNMGRRFSPVAADEDLGLGHLYIMFPMRRKRSVVTAADMAMLVMATTATARRITGGAAKVDYLKVSSDEGEESKVKIDEILDVFEMGEFGYKFGGCRSKKPLLDTISEEQPALSLSI